jgi:hypothetical protein
MDKNLIVLKFMQQENLLLHEFIVKLQSFQALASLGCVPPT